MEDFKQHSLLKGWWSRWQGVWCYPKASCLNKIVFADMDKIIKPENVSGVFLWRDLGL